LPLTNRKLPWKPPRQAAPPQGGDKGHEAASRDLAGPGRRAAGAGSSRGAVEGSHIHNRQSDPSTARLPVLRAHGSTRCAGTPPHGRPKVADARSRFRGPPATSAARSLLAGQKCGLVSPGSLKMTEIDVFGARRKRRAPISPLAGEKVISWA